MWVFVAAAASCGRHQMYRLPDVGLALLLQSPLLPARARLMTTMMMVVTMMMPMQCGDPVTALAGLRTTMHSYQRRRGGPAGLTLPNKRPKSQMVRVISLPKTRVLIQSMATSTRFLHDTCLDR